MERKPHVSIITAVFNGEKHLPRCLESINAQTLQDYEHIIVNDASTDSTPHILEEWQKKDPRIRVIHNPVNKGRAFSRNRALTRAAAPLLAILDADDYSLPNRLEMQTAFLEKHPDITLLGGDILIHESNQRLSHPESDADIRAQLFFDSALFHSSVMMRKPFLTKHRAFYDEALPLSQDYGLWATLMTYPETGFHNLQEPLSFYRLPESPRPGYRERQVSFANVVRAGILRLLDISPNKENMATHLALLFGNAQAFNVTPAQCENHAQNLLAANSHKNLTSTEALEKQLAVRINRIKLQQPGQA